MSPPRVGRNAGWRTWSGRSPRSSAPAASPGGRQRSCALKTTRAWLKAHLETSASLDDIAGKLVMLGLEVESIENYEVIRRRVLFEDVLLITFHREMGFWFILLNGLAGAFFLFIGVVVVRTQLRGNMWAYLAPWLVMAFPFLLFAALRAILGVEVISIFGRRSKAQIRFTFRKRRAREVYGRILARVRQAQKALASEVAESAVTAMPEVPMPPTESLLP